MRDTGVDDALRATRESSRPATRTGRPAARASRFTPGRTGQRIVFATLLLCVTHASSVGAESTGTPAVSPLIVFAPEVAAQVGSSTRPDEGNATLEAIRSDSAVSHMRTGRSAPTAIAAALDARVLSVVVPASADGPEVVLTFTGVDVEHNAESLVSLYARDEASDSEVALVIQGADVLGSIRRGDETWKVHPLGDGATAVYRYDTSRLRRHPPNWGEFMRENMWMQKRAPPRDDAVAAADTGDVIDILVAYTKAARNEAGNIDAFIQFAIDNTHRSYRNSNIGIRLRLVHKHQVRYLQNPNMGLDLDFLTNPDDGVMDEVHTLRDHFGADLVALIVGRESEFICGVAWIPNFVMFPDIDHSEIGFSVIAQNCETGTSHTFAHELGHNQGAAHNPSNAWNSPFPYGHGRCNVAEGWNTIMSYGWAEWGDCDDEIKYFSSPNIRYQGLPTGDAAVRDNRRVLLETARRVANFRQSVKHPPPLPGNSQTLPLVIAASNRNWPGFVRIINHSDRAGTVSIRAIDDTGRGFGPVSLPLEAKAAVQLSSTDLEDGNPSKGLSGGVGKGSGHWRLELSADMPIEALAYIRTPDGFVTSMNEVALGASEETIPYYVPFLNPGSNSSQRSLLRLVNPGSSRADIAITGVDDAGDVSPLGEVRFTLQAGAARMLSARELEQGGSRLTGRLGEGTGKWRLWVSADNPILVMSLLQLPTGHLTNLSRRQTNVSAGTLQPPDEPDLVIDPLSLDFQGYGNPHTNVATIWTLIVRNSGGVASSPTRLRLFQSSDFTISTSDTEIGSVAVGGISELGLRAFLEFVTPSRVGTYYYGACVDAVSQEVNIENNCTSAVRVEVSRGYRWFAFAAGWLSQHERCRDGTDGLVGWYSWRADSDPSSLREDSESSALTACQEDGIFGCRLLASTGDRAIASAYGESGSRCELFGGVGATLPAADRGALSKCRAQFPGPSDCSIWANLCLGDDKTCWPDAQADGRYSGTANLRFEPRGSFRTNDPKQ